MWSVQFAIGPIRIQSNSRLVQLEIFLLKAVNSEWTKILSTTYQQLVVVVDHKKFVLSN